MSVRARSTRRWAWLIVLIYLALAAATSISKRPFFDEAHFAAPALDLATRGSMGYPLKEPLGFSSSPGVPQLHIQSKVYYAPPLSFVAQAAWYKAVGFGVFRMRLLSTLWGLAALFAWFVIVQRLTRSDRVALVAVFLIGCDHYFIDAATSGRPDMMSASLGALGIAAYLHWRESNLSRAILVSQILAAAAAFTHPIGGIALVAIILAVLRFGWRRLRWRHGLIAAAPYVALAAMWGWYISLDPAAFRAQMAGNTAGRAGGLSSPLQYLIHEVTWRYLDRSYLPAFATGIRRLTVVIPAIYALAVVWLLVVRPAKRLGNGRLLAALAVCYFLAFAILDSAKVSFYLIHMTPLLACCTAVWLFAEWEAGTWRRLVSGAAVCILVVVQMAWNAYTISRDSYHKTYLPAIAYLKSHAGSGDLIFASSDFGFGLGFYGDVSDDATLGYFTGKRAAYIVVDDAGYGQAFKGFGARNPELEQYVNRALTDNYEKVYADQVYEIYHRR